MRHSGGKHSNLQATILLADRLYETARVAGMGAAGGVDE
jgi:hypothetical protein